MKLFFVVALLVGAAAIYVFSQPRLWGPFIYPLQYRDTIRNEAQASELDPNLVAAIIYVESRFYAGQKSHAGALGLMQLLPATAQSVAQSLGEEEVDQDKLLEPERNIRYGTFYFRYLLNRFDQDMDLALAAYNAGETNVDTWRREGQTDIPFPETKEFVRRVHEANEMYETIYETWYKEEP